MIVRTDEQLVKACLEGKEQAWSELIDKYKNLIYSISVKSGISREDSAEIFQQVCLGLLSELPRVRDPNCLAAWLIKVTTHKCFHWTRRERLPQRIDGEIEDANGAVPSARPDEYVLQLEREQILREAVSEISPRCRELIGMLFYQYPALPYDEVARNLNLARGSIGFIRMRCLKQLRDRLKAKGF